MIFTKDIFKLFSILLLASLLNSQTYGQTAEVSITVSLSGANVDVSLFIERTGATPWNLGFSSFVLDYNSSALSYTSELASGIWDSTTSTDYDDQINSTYGSSAKSIEIGRAAGGTSGTDIPQTPTLIGTLRFTFIPGHFGELHNIKWNEILSFFSTYGGSQVNNSNITFTNPSNGPLPVELSSFSASIKQNSVELRWQTKTEVDNYGFEVERRVALTSSDHQWTMIGFAEGNGNSNSPKDYSFIDKNAAGGNKLLYRLKQIDNDGNFEYSKEIEVELIPDKFELYQNYPNPFNPETTIKFALPKTSKVELSVYNLLGEKVATLINENKEAGYHIIQFNINNLSSGIYIYRLITTDFIKTMKMNFIK